MIGYVCKYTPVELVESFGIPTQKLEPSVSRFDHADRAMHPNVCSFARAILEEALQKGTKDILLVNCCDSIRRLFDVMKAHGSFGFLEILDLPRKTTGCAVTLFENELRRLVPKLEEFSGKPFDSRAFEQRVEKTAVAQSDLQEATSPRVALVGARAKREVVEMLQEAGLSICLDTTCTGNARHFFLQEDRPSLNAYASALLNQVPCMRMAQTNGRLEALEQVKGLEGIVYHTLKFCDFYGYDFSELSWKSSLPMLKIETDYTLSSTGQLQTRAEAFAESLRAKKGLEPVAKPGPKTGGLVAGIDIGSTSTNVVILDHHRRIVAFSIEKTGAKSEKGAKNALDSALQKAGIRREQLEKVVATGYGRNAIPFADETVTEISCHAKGALFFDSFVRTIIDIGGQDSKAIRVDGNGDVKDFAMNDKCAAGTGKFLEMMAHTLELEIARMGPLSLDARESIHISSMCTVFAESEVISLIAQNKEPSDIVRGLCDSIASRTVSLVKRVNPEERFMMTGGVAKNVGVVESLERKLSTRIVVPFEPQVVGAVGAALFALEKVGW